MTKKDKPELSYTTTLPTGRIGIQLVPLLKSSVNMVSKAHAFSSAVRRAQLSG